MGLIGADLDARQQFPMIDLKLAGRFHKRNNMNLEVMDNRVASHLLFSFKILVKMFISINNLYIFCRIQFSWNINFRKQEYKTIVCGVLKDNWQWHYQLWHIPSKYKLIIEVMIYLDQRNIHIVLNSIRFTETMTFAQLYSSRY